MADHSPIRQNENEVFPDDDPFAELTRIMGHDPRGEGADAAKDAVDDLALELESELLGELQDQEPLQSGDSAEAEALDAAVGPVVDNHVPADGDIHHLPHEPVVSQAIDQNDVFEGSLSSELEDSFSTAFEESLTEDSFSPEQEIGAASAEPNESESWEWARPDETLVADDKPQESDWAALDDQFSSLSVELETGLRAETEQASPAVDAIEAVQEPAMDEPLSADARALSESDAQSSSEPPSAYMHWATGDEPEIDPSMDLHASEEEVAIPVPQEAAEWALRDETTRQMDADAMAQVAEPYASVDAPRQPHDAKPEDSEYGSVVHFAKPSDAPDVATLDVPGDAPELADASHIPEYIAEPDPEPAQDNDLESVLARAFGETEDVPPRPQEPVYPQMTSGSAPLETPSGDRAADDDFDFDAAFATSFSEQGQTVEPVAQDMGAVAETSAATTPGFWQDRDDAPVSEDPESHDAFEPVEPQSDNRRGLMIAAVVGGVAVLGAVAIFAATMSGGDEPQALEIVRADNDPIKVKPEDPGGTQVPNQDNQVYQRVSSGENDTPPRQESLVSTAEEPVDVAAQAPSTDLVTRPKSEERLAASQEEDAGATPGTIAAIQPRRVRTMIVRPDGTIVAREPAAAETSVQSSGAPTGSANDAPATVAPAPVTAAPVTAAPVTAAPTEPENEPSLQVPQTAPVPATRPANPPARQQVAETEQPTRVAAAPSQPAQPAAAQPQPVVTAAPSGDWSVQISSQPSVDAAQQSYRDMAQRYGSLLTGKGVNIVKADIAGKGTYYRVRIPSASKNEAIQLCAQLKSAGGSCFVSK